MKEITKAEFDRHRIARQKAPVERLWSGGPVTTEKLWFKHSNWLGVICLDNVDDDWSWVALRRHNDGLYHCFDVGISCETVADAVRELNKRLWHGPQTERENELHELVTDMIERLRARGYKVE